ncbi:ATP-binding protein [Rhodothermus marinus]|uniref:ATP-binding protein n=1 Tax=Rhodothermus marinus TaxID=29549 RepID=UPI0012BA4C0E|nr:ATP-binding protein [Rhodothermus marinus]BBM69542.1 anti-sigma regulatory factor [Rhodothermus marinus]BBM72524.1 anti-sigma regulatory factor [Rhodothermus marinus]
MQKRLKIASRFEEMEQALLQIEALVRTLHFSPELIDRLLVVASEAITNAIRHGNREDPAKQVHITLDTRDDTIELCVEDEGPGFDRERIPRYNPNDPEMLLRPYGRGLFLMEELADEVFYEDGGRRVRMRLHRR